MPHRRFDRRAPTSTATAIAIGAGVDGFDSTERTPARGPTVSHSPAPEQRAITASILPHRPRVLDMQRASSTGSPRHTCQISYDNSDTSRHPTAPAAMARVAIDRGESHRSQPEQSRHREPPTGAPNARHGVRRCIHSGAVTRRHAAPSRGFSSAPHIGGGTPARAPRVGKIRSGGTSDAAASMPAACSRRMSAPFEKQRGTAATIRCFFDFTETAVKPTVTTLAKHARETGIAETDSPFAGMIRSARRRQTAFGPRSAKSKGRTTWPVSQDKRDRSVNYHHHGDGIGYG